MSARQELHSYISRIERRVRLDTLLRGAAILASAALGATVVVVILANARAFSGGSVAGGRLILFCVLAVAAAFGLAIPISRLSRRRAVSKAELRFPEFQQRLVTFTEKDDSEPFLDLLAADTLDVASGAEPAALAPNTTLLAMAGAGVACAGRAPLVDRGRTRIHGLWRAPAVDRIGAGHCAAVRSADQPRRRDRPPPRRSTGHRADRRPAVAARRAVCALPEHLEVGTCRHAAARRARRVTSSCSRACPRTSSTTSKRARRAHRISTSASSICRRSNRSR